MKIVFMGTPDFAAVALQAIYDAGHEIVLCVTQPDKEKGRGKVVAQSDVKLLATKLQIPVYQPDRIRNEECIDYLKAYEADAFVVAAFGQILPKEILDMPRLGSFNIHASLLPEYRGAAPIQWSIIDGRDITGVTIMKMDEGLDTGDIVSVARVSISPEDTGGSLFDKLAYEGAKLITETLPLIEKGEITLVKQDDSKSTYARMLKKEMGHIDFKLPAKSIENLIRGCNPWPGTYLMFGKKKLKVFKARVVKESGEAGTVIRVTKDSFTIACGEDALEILEVLPEGKKRMNAHDFLLGYHIEEGNRFE